MYHRTNGLKVFNFKSPYVVASWILTVAGVILANEVVGPSPRFSLEHFLKIVIVGVCFAAPLTLAAFLDYREVPEGAKVPEEEVESLLDFLDERDDLKYLVPTACVTTCQQATPQKQMGRREAGLCTRELMD